MEYDVAKHLEFIQNIINRMANTSFLLKGWAITLVAALFVLATKDTNANFAILALFPALSFWGLDAYYLRRERLFRRLYETICAAIGEGSRSIPPFSLDITEYRESVNGWFKTLWSPSVLALHGVIVVLVIMVISIVKSL